MIYFDLVDEDIDYLKNKFIETQNHGKYIRLLLDKDGKDITYKDYKDYGLNKNPKSLENFKYVLKSRLKNEFKKDGKGFFIDHNNRIKRNRENPFLNFLQQIQRFIEEKQGLGRNKIKTIKIYDEYRSDDKEKYMNDVFKYFEQKQKKFMGKIIIKSIASDIKTKNFLMNMSKTLSDVEVFIIKAEATRANASIYFVILEMNDKKSHLFYYDEELSYHDIDKQLDKNIKNLGLYGTIIKKFNKDKNYEKFDSNADFKNICGNIIQWFDNILVDNKSFNIHKNDIKKNLEKIQLYFPDNVASYNSLNLIMSFLEQLYNPSMIKNENNEYVLDLLKTKDTKTKIIKLLDKNKSKVY